MPPVEPAFAPDSASISPQRTWHAALLSARELVVLPAIDGAVRTVAIQALSSRTDARIVAFVELEIVRPKMAGLLGLLRRAFVIEWIGLALVLFLPFEAFIAAAHQAIGNDRGNAGVVQLTQVGFTVIAGIGRDDGLRFSQ